MKKNVTRLLTAALFLGLLGPLAHAEVLLSGTRQTSITAGTDSSNATIVAVSADDTKKTWVHGVSIAVSAADTILLQCGGSSTRQVGWYLGANSGVVQPLFPLALECRTDSSTLTGTIATTSGSATITGTSTTFTTDYAAGDRIVITNGDTLTLSSVTNNTTMTATANASTTVSGSAHKRGADNLRMTKGTSTTPLKYTLWYTQDISP